MKVGFCLHNEYIYWKIKVECNCGSHTWLLDPFECTRFNRFVTLLYYVTLKFPKISKSQFIQVNNQRPSSNELITVIFAICVNYFADENKVRNTGWRRELQSHESWNSNMHLKFYMLVNFADATSARTLFVLKRIYFG